MNSHPTDAFELVRVLKQDALGSVELVRCAHASWSLRRAAVGARGALARWLLRRERRALTALEGLAGVPRLAGAEACACTQAYSTRADVLLRSWIDGESLAAAQGLAADWFDNLRALVAAMHARGVCHNDLHKEPNLIAGADGWPWLVDFQLASVHPRRGRTFRVRCADDLRHVEKHRRRYRLAGAPKETLSAAERALPPRSPLAWAWRKSGKRVYNAITRSVPGLRDGEGRGAAEVRRGNAGPWPALLPARGPRP
jgi:predicted Ser/Thr protein kinase